VDEGSTTPADAQPTGSTATASDNQMQLLNLHYEVKRLTQFDQIFFNLVQEKMSTFFFQFYFLGWKKRSTRCCHYVTNSRRSSNRTRY
jgi:hypothetical protein